MSVYLDYASSTPIDPIVMEHYLDASANAWSNPSAPHKIGVKARIYLDKARSIVAETLGVSSQEIIFTSGASESNNLAFGVTSPKNILISSLEHQSISNIPGVNKLPFLFESNKLLAMLDDYLRNNRTIELISIVLASNETGHIMPLKEISACIANINIDRDRMQLQPIRLHTDATQAANYIHLKSIVKCVDMMTLSAHKFYAPKGSGILFKRKNVVLSPQIFGGGQEFGIRSGTENVPAHFAASHALQNTQSNVDKQSSHARNMLSLLRKYIANSEYNLLSPETECIDGICAFSLPNMDIQKALTYLDLNGFCVSSGSSCKSGSSEIGSTYKELGVSDTDAVIRVSVGKFTTFEEITLFIDALKRLTQL